MLKKDGYMLMRQIRAMSPEQGGQIPAIALFHLVRDGKLGLYIAVAKVIRTKLNTETLTR